MTAAAPLEPLEPLAPVSGEVLDEVRAHLDRYLRTTTESQLDVLTLWAAHTHLVEETYTSPRLMLDSPMPGSGKTTCLEHLERLCLRPVQMASLSSPALLTRMLSVEMRTLLIDEVDRSLSPDKDGVPELIAVLNSGYKRGATRPVLVPDGHGGWVAKEMKTYAPVAMAGNNPRLPEDTLSRTIKVLLMPDLDGQAEESDWELIDETTRELGARLAKWAESVSDWVKRRPVLPFEVKGRARERWSPLKRVADAAGGRWPGVVDQLAAEDVEQERLDREEGLLRDRPQVMLLKHLQEVWPLDKMFVPTTDLIGALIRTHPSEWGQFSPYGKALTAHRFGRMLRDSFGLHSLRPQRGGPHGFSWMSLEDVWTRMGIKVEPLRLPLFGTGASGSSGSSGAPDDDGEDEAVVCNHLASSTGHTGECRECKAEAMALVRAALQGEEVP